MHPGLILNHLVQAHAVRAVTAQVPHSLHVETRARIHLPWWSKKITYLAKMSRRLSLAQEGTTQIK